MVRMTATTCGSRNSRVSAALVCSGGTRVCASMRPRPVQANSHSTTTSSPTSSRKEPVTVRITGAMMLRMAYLSRMPRQVCPRLRPARMYCFPSSPERVPAVNWAICIVGRAIRARTGSTR